MVCTVDVDDVPVVQGLMFKLPCSVLVFRVHKDLVFGMSKILRLIGHSYEALDDTIIMFGCNGFSDEMSRKCRRSLGIGQVISICWVLKLMNWVLRNSLAVLQMSNLFACFDLLDLDKNKRNLATIAQILCYPTSAFETDVWSCFLISARLPGGRISRNESFDAI